jgi:hypothetical protein
MFFLRQPETACDHARESGFPGISQPLIVANRCGDADWHAGHQTRRRRAVAIDVPIQTIDRAKNYRIAAPPRTERRRSHPTQLTPF